MTLSPGAFSQPKQVRDALVRLRAALLDLQAAGCYAAAAELAALIKRVESAS